MANNKKFVVKNGLTTSNIEFKDDINNGTNTITMSMLSTDVLSFSGDSGQLFSISDSLTGTIFSVNDISGIPSVEVDDDGTIRLAEFAGNILVGSNTDNGSDKLQVTGNTSVDGTVKATDFTIGTSGKLTSNNYVQTFVAGEIAGLVDSAPTTLDTLNELAAALGDDANFSTTVTNSLATKASNNYLQSQLSTKLNSSSYTASDVLTKIKTVDGSGSGLDADLLDGISSASFLRSDADDTATGNLTFTGNVDHTGEYKGVYHTVVEDRYYFDNYNGARNVNAFLETQRSDIIRYGDIGDVEYWDGSAWQDASSQLSNVEKLLDGRQDTSWSVPSTYYKFRFTVTASTSWPTMALIGMQTSWTGSTYPGCQLLVEELQTDSSWLTKVTADFTSSNGITTWGTMFRADSALHTGRGSQTHATRITIDFDGWTPSNASYQTIPLQNVFIFSNYAGTENNDYKSLLDYDRNINAPNNITVAGTVDGRDIAADGTKLDGIESGATADQTASEILTAIKTVDGSGSGLDADTLDGLQGSSFSSNNYLQGQLNSKLSTTGTAAQATNLNATDDRDIAPEDLSYSDDFRIYFAEKGGLETGTIGSNYQDVLVLNSYSDSSGGDTNALAFDKSEKKIYHYQADQSATNWGTAKTLAYTDDISLSTLSITATAAEINKLDGVTATTTELNYVDGVTSNIQTQLNAKLNSSSYTASDVLTKIKTVDGSGSGLDADLLDGAQPSVSASNDTIVKRHSSGYIFANYFNTTPNDVSSGVTKVLVETGNDGYMRHGTQAAIRTFIGAGSGNGLDADLLDGQQGSYYTGAKGTNQNYVASSTSTSNRGNYGSGVWAYSGYSSGSNRPFTYDATLQVMPNSNMGFEISIDWVSSTSTPIKIRSLRDCCQGWSDYSTIWTSTTDGSGSGLDADLLDGQQGSYYQPASTALNTSTSFGGDVSGTYNNIVVSNDSHNHSSSSGNFTVGGDLTVSGGQVTMAGVPTRDKYRVWSSSTYAIGMDNNFTFGGLATEYAMTFQMNDQATRGFWWGDSAHTDAQGAMALTTNGKLTVAHSTRIGYGETDTTTPGATHRVDVNGSVNATTYHGDGSNLTGISAGATGGGSDKIFYNNDQTVTTSYTIPSGQNSMTAGPISINSGVTVTIPSGSEWTIV